MKISITFKDPDVVYDAVKDAVTEEVNALPDLDEDEKQTSSNPESRRSTPPSKSGSRTGST